MARDEAEGDRQPNRQQGMLRRTAPEAALLLGAGRAILLQLAEPRIGLAVVRHSDFASNPMRRLHNTLAYVYALGVGTERQQAKVIDYVNGVHAPVRAPRDPGKGTPAYSARDPKLQLWVAATLYDSAVAAARKTLPRLTDAEQEQLYREYATLGGALQMPAELWPEDTRAFDSYFQSMLGQLRVGDEVRAAARELFTGANASWWMRLLLPVVRDVTIAQLPEAVRRLYGYELTARVRRRHRTVTVLAKAGSRVLPPVVRHAPMRWALRRIDEGRLG